MGEALNVSRRERRALEARNRKWPDTLVTIPEEDWPGATWAAKARPCSVWRSRFFLVQVFQERDDIFRLSVCRTSVVGNSWQDGISWQELQDLKRQCGFGEMDAVEVFPKDCDVVNVANMRHLWVMPEQLPFAWRSRASTAPLPDEGGAGG